MILFLIESAPKDGPTVFLLCISNGAGRLPDFSIIAKSRASLSGNPPLPPWVIIASPPSILCLMLGAETILLSRSMASLLGSVPSSLCFSVISAKI